MMRAIISDQSGEFDSQPIDLDTVVAAINLPPGNWLLFASIAFFTSQETGAAMVSLSFEALGEVFGGMTSVITAPHGQFGYQVVPLNTAVVVEKPHSVRVLCSSTPPGSVRSLPSTIIALEVSSITHVRTQFPTWPEALADDRSQ